MMISGKKAVLTQDINIGGHMYRKGTAFSFIQALDNATYHIRVFDNGMSQDLNTPLFDLEYRLISDEVFNELI